MRGVAVNVTEVPAQTGFAEGDTETLTGRFGLTIIVIVFDVSGLFDVHTTFEEVRTHDTRSPDAGL